MYPSSHHFTHGVVKNNKNWYPKLNSALVTITPPTYWYWNTKYEYPQTWNWTMNEWRIERMHPYKFRSYRVWWQTNYPCIPYCFYQYDSLLVLWQLIISPIIAHMQCLVSRRVIVVPNKDTNHSHFNWLTDICLSLKHILLGFVTGQVVILRHF